MTSQTTSIPAANVAEMDLNNRLVVVTGGGSGIGESLCTQAKARGASKVVVADLNGDQAQRVAALVDGEALEIDVSDADAYTAAIKAIEDAHGPVGLFCSNAGYVTSAGLEDTNESVDKMWQVHVMAHITAARAVLPSMIANGGGHLLQTASAAGLLSQIGSMAYSVTKHAAIALAEWISISHDHQNIGVSVLCPQAVRTNILHNSPDRIEDPDGDGFGVAAGDGILEPVDVANLSLDAVEQGRFWVLPHPEVAEYHKRKATDVERWLAGMRRFQGQLFGDAPLPGDAIAP